MTNVVPSTLAVIQICCQVCIDGSERKIQVGSMVCPDKTLLKRTCKSIFIIKHVAENIHVSNVYLNLFNYKTGMQKNELQILSTNVEFSHQNNVPLFKKNM
jgi:hypothetical protein